MIILTGIVSIIIFVLYIMDVNKNKFTTKTMVITAMMSAIAYVLYMVPLIKYPQGGGITLMSMLPIMLLSILCGRTAGLTGGILFGLCKLLNGAFIIHPVQFILDFILSTMALGLADTFGHDKKYKIICGALLATGIALFFNTLSGVLFFGQYAPEGMNILLYSFIYNGTSVGVEGVITSILLALVPIKRFLKITER